ncbi:nuclear transport factor 2 family protein [Actinophytocola sp.]|uniref:nuclear transport factor 2 family protein n=1 Tax=Actinophytocola sp. TaxID=1872138 RepID=UPI003D6C4818
MMPGAIHPAPDSAQRVLDWIELHDLMSRYVHLVDHSAWDRLDEVFTDDAVVDYRNFAPYIPRLEGLAAIQDYFGSMEQPIAHHTVNSLITAAEDRDLRRITSKIVLVMRDRQIYVGEYRDRVARTDRGWRFTERLAARPFRLGNSLPVEL